MFITVLISSGMLFREAETRVGGGTKAISEGVSRERQPVSAGKSIRLSPSLSMPSLHCVVVAVSSSSVAHEHAVSQTVLSKQKSVCPSPSLSIPSPQARTGPVKSASLS